MKNSLTFNIPFSGFCGTTFINCFASTYMFLENISADSNYECKQRNGQPCDDCGTDNNVDFLFGFTGYEYRKLITPAEFKSAIVASIDAGKPVIAKVKTGWSASGRSWNTTSKKTFGAAMPK